MLESYLRSKEKTTFNLLGFIAFPLLLELTGPLETRWKNRRSTCDALVLPNADEIFLGAIPLEAMDLTINPRRELVGAHGDQVLHRI